MDASNVQSSVAECRSPEVRITNPEICRIVDDYRRRGGFSTTSGAAQQIVREWDKAQRKQTIPSSLPPEGGGSGSS